MKETYLRGSNPYRRVESSLVLSWYLVDPPGSSFDVQYRPQNVCRIPSSCNPVVQRSSSTLDVAGGGIEEMQRRQTSFSAFWLGAVSIPAALLPLGNSSFLRLSHTLLSSRCRYTSDWDYYITDWNSGSR
jgi:hypothetical protein